MSDLLAPILRLVGDEEETFWCFVGLMEMEEKMFEISQGLMKTQLECLGKLIKYMYPNFWTFLGTFIIFLFMKRKATNTREIVMESFMLPIVFICAL